VDNNTVRKRFLEEQEYLKRYMDFIFSETAIFEADIRELKIFYQDTIYLN
jgi:hypothetical protein